MLSPKRVRLRTADGRTASNVLCHLVHGTGYAVFYMDGPQRADHFSLAALQTGKVNRVGMDGVWYRVSRQTVEDGRGIVLLLRKPREEKRK